ncbi:hypothetical protein MLD38_027668 [Melastoma candidum]|uniref:Uncharacterized protein n=1 Tax=Melastoma candidum TaxID=119954 RepID=A0ACB9P402_9MYRT|nr:hypothetical protein MLD38_027668 [Melastoma candidum]
MDSRRKKKQAKSTNTDSEEVSSLEWDYIEMSDQEEDLVRRMYRLVGDSITADGLRSDGRWDLIAGRILGRKPEELERFWMMKYGDAFAEKRDRRAATSSDRAVRS